MPKKKNTRQKHQKDVSFAETSEEEMNNTSEQVIGKVCSHISRGINFGRIKKNLKSAESLSLCSACENTVSEADNFEVWLCLQCGYRGCGRMTDNKHGLQHYKTIHSDCHSLVLSTSSGVVWCYDCDDAVLLQSSRNLKQCVEYIMKLKMGVNLVQESLNDNTKKDATIGNSECFTKSASEEGKSQKKISGVLKKETAVPKIVVKGLRNLGNTCFFNAVMQNLSQTHLLFHELERSCSPEFSWDVPKFIYNDDGRITEDISSSPMKLSLPRQFSLVNSLFNFFKQMYAVSASKVDIVNPSALFGEISKKSPQFSHYHQQDSHELLRQLLDGVRQEEIKRQKKAILKVLHLENAHPDDVDDSTRKLVKEYSSHASHTIVEKIFGGLLISTVLCEECKMSSQVFEPFMDLSLPLFEEKPLRAKKSEIDNDDYNSEFVLKSKNEPAKPSKYQEKKMKQLARKEKRKSKNTKNKNFFETESDIVINDEQGNLRENVADGENKLLHDDSMHTGNESVEQAEKEPKDHNSISVLLNEMNYVSDSSLKETDEEISMDGQSVDLESKKANCNSQSREFHKNIFGDKQENTQPNCSENKSKEGDEPNFSKMNGLFSEKANEESSEKKTEVDSIGEKTTDEADQKFLEKADEEDSEKGTAKYISQKTDSLEDLCMKFRHMLNKENSFDKGTNCTERLSPVPLLPNGSDCSFSNHFGSLSLEQSINLDENEGSSPLPLIKTADYNQLECETETVNESGNLNSMDLSGLDERMQVLSMQVKEVRIRKDSDKQENILNTSQNVIDSESKRKNCITHNNAEDGDEKNENGDSWSYSLAEDETKEWISKTLKTLKPRTHFSPNECSINSCLSHFTKPELLTGSNKFRCESCTKMKREKTGNQREVVYSNANKQLLIFSPPAILTLHLKRFQQVGMSLRKDNRFVEFPITLDLASFCSSACVMLPHMASTENEILYSLYGIVEHSGRLTSGHYTACVKISQRTSSSLKKAFQNEYPLAQCEVEHLLHKFSKFKSSVCENRERTDSMEDSKWYYISDTHVKEVTEAQVLKSQAYLLFYERIK